MDRIEEYLMQQDKIIMEERQRVLIALGLTEKEYSPYGIKTYEYSQCEYVDGKPQYYRLVAMKVTDEEWAQIIAKAEQVETINKRNEERKLIEQKKKQTKLIRKIAPIFKKEIKPSIFSELGLSEKKEKVDTEVGKSKWGGSIRIFAWIILVAGILCFVFMDVESEVQIAVYLCAFGTWAVLMGFAGILDYLAEITAILRGGFTIDNENEDHVK